MAKGVFWSIGLRADQRIGCKGEPATDASNPVSTAVIVVLVDSICASLPTRWPPPHHSQHWVILQHHASQSTCHPHMSGKLLGRCNAAHADTKVETRAAVAANITQSHGSAHFSQEGRSSAGSPHTGLGRYSNMKYLKLWRPAQAY